MILQFAANMLVIFLVNIQKELVTVTEMFGGADSMLVMKAVTQHSIEGAPEVDVDRSVQAAVGEGGLLRQPECGEVVQVRHSERISRHQSQHSGELSRHQSQLLRRQSQNHAHQLL
mmetsp:Transcript_47521/g.64694  ORF Transcript_47521/g.64694 Transcript_47521/m.64694 type:complete len:116 (-) Transcript_47521:294-641(-)